MTTAHTAKICIYGAGAMGTVLGTLLTLGGGEVHLVTRNAAHIKGLKEKGATVLATAEGKSFQSKVTALSPSEMTEKYDIVFLMTKQKNNAEIVTEIAPFLHENSIVCTTQNGLPEPSVAQIIGTERTYGGVASFGATFVGEGEVELTSKFQGMRIEVGGYQNDGKKSALLLEVLSLAGKVIGNENFARITDNLEGARWAKLCINAAFSGLSTVTGLPFGKVAKKKKTRKIALGILREGMAVAKASGITLAKMQGHDMEKMLGGTTPFQRLRAYILLPFAMKKHKKLYSGMLKDIEKGKKCEIDFIDGVICREGEKVGVPTPLCQQIVEMTHGIENGLYEIDYKNADFFEI